MDLKFEAKYFSNKAYYVRGDFYNSDDGTINIRTESTEYTGIHYIQCFIINKNKCIAKSKEFIVRVK